MYEQSETRDYFAESNHLLSDNECRCYWWQEIFETDPGPMTSNLLKHYETSLLPMGPTLLLVIMKNTATSTTISNIYHKHEFMFSIMK